MLVRYGSWTLLKLPMAVEDVHQATCLISRCLSGSSAKHVHYMLLENS